ncbi:MAG: HD domain-containing protein [Candidatus Acidiferrales bacterium]
MSTTDSRPNFDKLPVAPKPLGPRFRKAMVYSACLHSRQARRGTDRPYIGHLLGVAAIVLQYGGDEDQAIAALLHDAVEDQGGRATLDAIRRRFGERVAKIVEGCTDAFETPKPPWLERKKKYIENVRHEPAEVRLVSAADKLYNVREIIQDYRVHGEAVWQRFQGGREGSLRYYRELVHAFREAESNELVEELDRAVSELHQLAGAKI